mmetsp:Transcript_27119/g.80768  ORF Transcript_27119/g.80768 Transcript_27119/m.80768 type:complete len:176 (-) Transcript_27119:63-590(-)
MVHTGRPGAVVLAILAVLLAGNCFVQGPHAARPTTRSLRRASTAPDSKAAGDKEVKKADTNEDQIDDAVLKMAMAMAEEEEGGAPATKKEEKKEEDGFDFNILIQFFWTALIVYSFGSSIIGVTQGRIQDRTGGEFTAYDFFDNIFSFKDWNLEYTLGFDPVKVVNDLTKGKGSA